jgi:hypothetical protein
MSARIRIAALVAILLAPTVASGQSGNNIDVLIDLSRERDYARQADESGLSPQQRAAATFETLQYLKNPLATACPWLDIVACRLDVVVPMSYSSNPLGQPTQTSDGHAKPDIILHFTTPLGTNLSLSGFADVSFNRYINTSSADADALRFWLGASYSPSKAVSLYLGYRPSLTFAPTFSELRATFNDVLAGVQASYNIDNAFRRDYPVKLMLDLNVGYRGADPSSFSAMISTMSLGAIYSYCRKGDDKTCIGTPDPGHFPLWQVSVKPSVNLSWYDNSVQGQTRHDVRVGFLATAAWWPFYRESSLLNGLSVLGLVSFSRNSSNIVGRSFTSWDVGPALRWVLGQGAGVEPTRRFLSAQDR